MLEDFLKTDNIAAAKKVVTDLGLTPGLIRCRVTRFVDTGSSARGFSGDLEKAL